MTRPPNEAQLAALLDLEGHEPCPGVRIDRDVEIQRIDGWRQHATIFRPEGVAVAVPAAVLFHGGGYVAGHPDGCGMLGKYLAASLGMVTVAASYRLAVEGPTFPLPVHDAGDAWRWTALQAARWGIDPARMVMGGDSAGANIAATAMLTMHDRGLGGGGRIGGDAPPARAFIAQWGPMDLVARWFDNGQRPGAEAALLGTDYPLDPTLYHRASPLSHVRPGAPPAIFVYGNQDPVVHPRQGALGRAAWEAAGARAELLSLDNIGHGVTGDNRAQRLEMCRRIAAFLDAALARGRALEPAVTGS